MGKSGRTYFLTITAICIGTFLITGCASKNKEFVLSSNVKEDLNDKGDYVYRLKQSNDNYNIYPIQQEDIEHLQAQTTTNSSSDKQYVKNNVKENISYNTNKDSKNYIKNEDKKQDSNVSNHDNSDKKVIDNQLTLNENGGDSVNIFFERYDDDYTTFLLPSVVEVKVEGETKKDYVQWDRIGQTAYSEGRYIYHGVTAQYGKTVNATLTVKKSVYNKIIGVIKNAYIKNGSLYMDVDEAEFYTGAQALDEAIKDYNAGKSDAVQVGEDSKYYLLDGYYIRNTSEDIRTIKVSDNAKLYLLGFEVDSSVGNSNMQKVDRDTFKAYIDSMKDQCDRASLCTIYCQDDDAVEVARIFTP